MADRYMGGGGGPVPTALEGFQATLRKVQTRIQAVTGKTPAQDLARPLASLRKATLRLQARLAELSAGKEEAGVDPLALIVLQELFKGIPELCDRAPEGQILTAFARLKGRAERPLQDRLRMSAVRSLALAHQEELTPALLAESVAAVQPPAGRAFQLQDDLRDRILKSSRLPLDQLLGEDGVLTLEALDQLAFPDTGFSGPGPDFLLRVLRWDHDFLVNLGNRLANRTCSPRTRALLATLLRLKGEYYRDGADGFLQMAAENRRLAGLDKAATEALNRERSWRHTTAWYLQTYLARLTNLTRALIHHFR